MPQTSEQRSSNIYNKSVAQGRASHLSTVKSLGLLHDLQEYIISIESLAAEQAREVQRLKDEKRDAERTVVRYETDTVGARDAVGALALYSADIKELPPRVRAMLEDNKMLKDEVRKAKQRIKEVEAQLARCEVEVLAAQAKNKELKQNLAACSRTMEDVKKEEEERQQVATLAQRIQELEKANMVLKSKTMSDERRLAVVKTDLKRENAGTQRMLAEVKEQLVAKDNQLRAAMLEIRALQRRLVPGAVRQSRPQLYGDLPPLPESSRSSEGAGQEPVAPSSSSPRVLQPEPTMTAMAPQDQPPPEVVQEPEAVPDDVADAGPPGPDEGVEAVPPEEEAEAQPEPTADEAADDGTEGGPVPGAEGEEAPVGDEEADAEEGAAEDAGAGDVAGGAEEGDPSGPGAEEDEDGLPPAAAEGSATEAEAGAPLEDGAFAEEGEVPEEGIVEEDPASAPPPGEDEDMPMMGDMPATSNGEEEAETSGGLAEAGPMEQGDELNASGDMAPDAAAGADEPPMPEGETSRAEDEPSPEDEPLSDGIGEAEAADMDGGEAQEGIEVEQSGGEDQEGAGDTFGAGAEGAEAEGEDLVAGDGSGDELPGASPVPVPPAPHPPAPAPPPPFGRTAERVEKSMKARVGSHDAPATGPSRSTGASGAHGPRPVRR